jgi:hypothetical protein
MHPIRFYSCSISHSSKDQVFADRLHSRMVQEKLWICYAPDDMRGGIWPRLPGGRRNVDESLQFGSARFGWIDRSVERSPCALRCRRTDADEDCLIRLRSSASIRQTILAKLAR